MIQISRIKVSAKDVHLIFTCKISFTIKLENLITLVLDIFRISLREEQLNGAQEVAKDTIDLRSIDPHNNNLNFNRVRVSDYIGICYYDHEKTIAGIIEDIKYNELFEQLTFVFKMVVRVLWKFHVQISYGYG
jgi:hypothetical protein